MILAETSAGSDAHTNGAGHWSTLYVVLYIGWGVTLVITAVDTCRVSTPQHHNTTKAVARSTPTNNIYTDYYK